MTADRITFRWPSSAELRWAAGFAAIVMALTCLPYLYGLLIRPENAYYSGLISNPDEHNVYLAYMRQYQEGAVFLIDPFTSEPQRGRVINLFFLVLGRIGQFTDLTLPIIYHLARLTSGWLLLVAIYCLAAQAIQALWARRLALVLAAFASGFGWLYHAGPGQPHPIDYGPGLVMPEAITFLTLLLNPLFCFSVFLMIAAIGLGAQALSGGSLRSAALAGLACLILGNIHTYDVIPVAVVLSSYLVVVVMRRKPHPASRFTISPDHGSPSPRAERGAGGEVRTHAETGKRGEVRRALAAAALIALIASPSLLYQAWLLHSGEITLAIKTAETPVYTPEPLFLALGLGLPLALALLGLWRACRRDGSDGLRLLALWLVLGFALAYAPVPFQRKLAEGVQVPAILLAVAGIETFLARLPRLRVPIVALLVVATLPSSALFLLRAKHNLETNNRDYLGNFMPPLYLRDDQYAALKWLDAHASFQDVLLCNSFLGNYAPSLAGTRVYVGHWAETLHYGSKLKDFAVFLRVTTPNESREALLHSNGIAYVLRDYSFYDDISLLTRSGSVIPAFDPNRAPSLEPQWSGGAVAIYRVR